MKDKELDAKLKKAKVPKRPATFWKRFPRRISRRIKKAQGCGG